jgi:hypothetical protein
VAAAAGRTVRGDADVEDTTGPRMLTRVFEALPACDRQRIRLVPQVLLVPPTLPPVIEWWVAPYARHHFAGTWKRDPARPRSPWRRWVERDLMPPLRPALSVEGQDEE